MCSDQDNLFSSETEESRLEREYKSFLEDRGYEVIKLKEGKKSVTIADVVENFYRNLKHTCGDQITLVARLSDKKDFQAVARFHEKAKKVGLSKSAANETLLDLISLVFSYYEDTGKPCPLTDLSYLISQKGSWMVQMAIQHNRKVEKNWEDSEEAAVIRKAIYSDLDNSVFQSLQEEAHNRILNKQENSSNDKENKDS